MKFHVKYHISLGLVFFLRLGLTGGKTPEELKIFMQKNVESLIEKVLSQVQEYYQEIKLNAKCIPNYVPDSVIETLKKSIDCVSENERNYANSKINYKKHSKNFLNCFSKAKEEVNKTITAIASYENYCPENTTEINYQINLTTAFTKTFRINIKNGLEVTHKEINFSKNNGLNGDNGGNESGNDEHKNNNDSNSDDQNVKHNDEHQNTHKTDTKQEYESYDYNNNESDSNKDDSDEDDDENGSEEDSTDEYSINYNNPKDDQENSFDEYYDIDRSSSNIQFNNKSIDCTSNYNINYSKSEVNNNDTISSIEEIFGNKSEKR